VYLEVLDPAGTLATGLDAQVGVGVVSDASQFTTPGAP
jgi:hypothetical protein